MARRAPGYRDGEYIGGYLGGIAQLLAAESGGNVTFVDAVEHAPQQIVIMLVAVWPGIEIVRHFGQALVADPL